MSSNAFYSAPITEFLEKNDEGIIESLVANQARLNFRIEEMQMLAWKQEIPFLKMALKKYGNSDNAILFEYSIPRRNKRIDVVLTICGIVFVLEFKVGATSFNRADVAQVEDYALDLKDFHVESRDRKIIPILIATQSHQSQTSLSVGDQYIPGVVGISESTDLERIIEKEIILSNKVEKRIDCRKWDLSNYEPTPTIIEAAQHLFCNHTVADITHCGADKINLSETIEEVVKIVNHSRANNKKSIIFITGVPGAGKTLAGLTIAHDNKITSQGINAVFLSGNGPLVKVLQRALAEDYFRHFNITMAEAERKASVGIQSVYGFKKHYHNNTEDKPEHVIIFDEAQRAWNLSQMKKKNPEYSASEPEMLLSILDRRDDWCSLVCLVGSGQEIHDGEAGLREWGNTLKDKYPNFEIYLSDYMLTGELRNGGSTLFDHKPDHLQVETLKNLHLAVSIRTYRAAKLSDWVALVLDGRAEEARDLATMNLTTYPIAITRDLLFAKKWLQLHCRGSRRMGIVLSSGGKRLRAEGLDPDMDREAGNKVPYWFLKDSDDVRSSSFLEVPCTEFEVQGLEVDWACIAWDQDLARMDNCWWFRSFKGTQWRDVRNIVEREYMLNKYRVIMTRAREGMIIYIPSGSDEDRTRNPSVYDEIFTYLVNCGINQITGT
jgi:hypothetical protein